jgi:N-methylhydantoinase A
VLVNARVAAIGAVFVPEPEQGGANSTAPCLPRSRRKVYFGTWREVAVYALDELRPGQTLQGPAIIEAETTTVVINEGDALSVNTLGWLDIRVAKSGTAA